MDRYWIGTGGNYSSTANWSDTDGGGGGFSVPTSTDNVFFTASSGDCIVNVSSSCLNLDFTGYTNTITTTDQLNIFGSSIIFASGMSSNGANGFAPSASATIVCNGFVIHTINFTFGIATFTLADDLYCVNFRTVGNGNVFNGNNMYISGNFTIANSTAAGTTIFHLIGTGIWSGAYQFSNNLFINTAGTITISGIVYYAGTLTYTAGTVVTTGSTLYTVNCTLDTDGMIWDNILNLYGPLTLTSNLRCNTFSNSNPAVINGFQIAANTFGFGNSFISGTTTFLADGTGSLSGTGLVYGLITINTTGDITIGSTLHCSYLVYVTANSVTTTGSTLSCNNDNASWDTDGIFGSGGDLYKRTRMDVNYPPGIDSSVNAPYVALRTTGNQVILSRLSSTTVYAYNDGVSSNAASTSTTLSSAEFPLFCIYNISTYNNNTLSTHIYDTIGYGLTDAEAAMFYTVVNDLQKKLKRQ